MIYRAKHRSGLIRAISSQAAAEHGRMFMGSKVSTVLASILIVAGISVTPVGAQGLLGGLTDTVGGVVDTVTDTVTDTVDNVAGGDEGGTNVGNIASVNDDNNEALVNLDVGGDSNILNAAVGSGANPLANANVSSTGLLSNTIVTLDLAGLGLDLTIGLSELGGGGGAGGGNGVGGNGAPGGAGNGLSGGRAILVGSLGGANFVINCAVNNTRQLLQIAAAGKISGAEIKAWMRAANVQVVPIKLCPAAKKQVAQILTKSKKINLLRRAVMSDALITASLGRTRYDAGDVVAVQRKGGQLVVYVF
jgi:hypothetical protein